MKKASIFFCLIFLCVLSKAQTFDLYVANDGPVDSVTYEFDILMRSTTSTVWAFRTIQFSFFVNSAWLPTGVDPTISYINGSSTLAFFHPGNLAMNASPGSLSAFQYASNAAGVCNGHTQFTQNGQVEKVGRFRIVSNAGPMNCVSNDLSFIRPTDASPGGNVPLRVAVTKWTDPSCNPATATNISNNGTYMTVANGGILVDQFNSMAPTISVQPSDTVVLDCDSTQFFVSASAVISQNTPITYQWYENGSVILNNSFFHGVNNDTLTITHPLISMNGHTFYAVVSQCIAHHSDTATLSVLPCVGISEVNDNAGITLYPNPTQGKIFIQLLSDFKSIKIEVINSLSQVVYHSDYKLKKGLTKELNLNLPAGIYFIRFYSIDSYVQRKIVIE